MKRNKKPVYGQSMVPGVKCGNITIREVTRPVGSSSNHYIVTCKCGRGMELKRSTLLEGRFACPRCENYRTREKPLPFPDAPYTVLELNHLVPFMRGGRNHQYPVVMEVWYVRCNCGNLTMARSDFIENGTFPGCKDCAPSALFRARHGLR